MAKRIERPPLSERELSQRGPRALKERDSVGFAYQQTEWLKILYSSKAASELHFNEALAEAEEHRIFDKIPPEKPYGSMENLLKAEMGVTVATAKQLRDALSVAKENK